MFVAACMWPNMSEAMEQVAKDMLPDMLDQNKPTWMTKLSLDTWVHAVSPANVMLKVYPATFLGYLSAAAVLLAC